LKLQVVIPDLNAVDVSESRVDDLDFVDDPSTLRPSRETRKESVERELSRSMEDGSGGDEERSLDDRLVRVVLDGSFAIFDGEEEDFGLSPLALLDEREEAALLLDVSECVNVI
jgi:hypothetical protein